MVMSILFLSITGYIKIFTLSFIIIQYFCGFQIRFLLIKYRDSLMRRDAYNIRPSPETGEEPQYYT